MHVRGEMICVDTLHIGLNKFLLLAVGLWPYQQSKLVQLQLILFFGVLTTFILFQFTTFLISQCTADLFINVISCVLFFTVFLIKYSFCSINVEVIKYFLEQLQHIYNELTDENEINIIKQYAIKAKRYTATLMLLATLIVPVLLSYSIWPCIFDILLPINETRPHPPPLLITEYFVDQERYFYLITLHTIAAFAIGGSAMLAIGTMLIVYAYYACGMFRIASYRIERTMTIKTLQENSLKNENLIYKKLIRAVDMHRKAMKFCHWIKSTFQTMFFFLIIVGVTCDSLNFFRVFQAISFGYGNEELLLRVIMIIVHVSYIFLVNYFGQEIIDHNNDIFFTVYNIQWYSASLQVQRMVLFLLQRSSKAFTMNIAGVFVGSLETAAMLMSTIISYFTVLLSMQN